MTDKNAALAAGFHFMITGVDLKNQTRVVLDYVFGRPGPAKEEDNKKKHDKKNKPGETHGKPSKPGEGSTPSEPTKPGGGTNSPPPLADKPGEPPADNPGKTPKEDGKEMAEKKDGTKQVAPLKNQQGFLTFSNIGVDYRVEKNSNTLFIEFDAKCVVGPLGATLVGFALYIQFRNDSTFQYLKLDNVLIGFEGLIIAFDKPPVTLTGVELSSALSCGA